MIEKILQNIAEKLELEKEIVNFFRSGLNPYEIVTVNKLAGLKTLESDYGKILEFIKRTFQEKIQEESRKILREDPNDHGWDWR
jgi:hypothetical protein